MTSDRGPDLPCERRAKIDRYAVESAVALDLLHDRRSVVLVAPQGLDEIGYLAFDAADRVVQHADVLAIEAKSYRLREAEEANRRPRKARS